LLQPPYLPLSPLPGAISLQLTVPIVSALGIRYGDRLDFSGFAALPQLVGIQVACNGLVLLVLALLWFVPRRQAPRPNPDP